MQRNVEYKGYMHDLGSGYMAPCSFWSIDDTMIGVVHSGRTYIFHKRDAGDLRHGRMPGAAFTQWAEFQGPKEKITVGLYKIERFEHR